MKAVPSTREIHILQLPQLKKALRLSHFTPHFDQTITGHMVKRSSQM